MQKPVFYAVVGVSLIVTAVSLGISASRSLSLRYYSPPAPPAGREPSAPERRDASLPPERWTNVFAPRRGMEIPSRLAAGAKTSDASPPIAYVLLGTISSESRTARRAILWAEGMKDPRTAREQEEIEPGVRVGRIERDHVWIARGKTKEKLDLLPVGSRARAATPPVAPSPAGARSAETVAAPGSTIRVGKIGENVYSLDESSVAQLTGNINQHMTQVRLIPYFEGNKSAGYRLAAIRPGSTFEQLGFRGGDIIQQVNSVELSSPEKMYTIFQNLKDEKKVTVNILRQGQKSTITYEIR